MAERAGGVETPVTIKKYANRRLYNTASSSYVTLEDLCRMVQSGTDFLVYDAKTGDDLTRAVLTQIIVEEEQKGTNLLPIGFLRQLIRCYGDNMQWMVPRYLDHMMGAFKRHQDQLKTQLHSSFGGIFPFTSIEEVGKHNVALLEQTMQLLNPFGVTPPGGTQEPGTIGAPPASIQPITRDASIEAPTRDASIEAPTRDASIEAPTRDASIEAPTRDASIEAMRRQLAAMQAQVDALTRRQGKPRADPGEK